MLSDRRLLFGLLAAYVAIYILPLGQRPLYTPDESRYAEVSREMRSSGDWTVPRLNGKRYFEKPAMGYWLVALSQEILGENAFASRLPGALAAGLMLLATWWLVRRSGGTPLAAALAAGVLLSCAEFYGVATFLVLDIMLAAAVTAGLACFYVAYRETRKLPRSAFLALFGLACGAAFLIKGFVGLAVPCAVIAPFIFWQHFPEGLWPVVHAGKGGLLLRAALSCAGNLLRLAPIPLAAAAAVALPWSLMIHQREPDFWHYFFWVQHVQRAAGDDAQHAAPFWYYLPVLIGGAMPWSAFLPATAAGTRGQELLKPFTRFLVCWAVVPFLFFSAMKGKLGTYILPVFPALAILTATGLTRYLEAGRRRVFNLAALIPAGILSLGAIGLMVWQATGQSPALFGPGETWKLLTGCAALLAWAACAWLAVRAPAAPRKLQFMIAAPLALCLAMPFIVPDRISANRSPDALLTRNRGRIPPDSKVYARPRLAHSCAWNLKRTDIVLFDRASEFEYGIESSPDPAAGRVKVKDFAAAVTRAPQEQVFTLAIERKRYEEIRTVLPSPFFEERAGDCLLLQFHGQSGGLRDGGTPTYREAMQ